MRRSTLKGLLHHSAWRKALEHRLQALTPQRLADSLHCGLGMLGRPLVPASTAHTAMATLSSVSVQLTPEDFTTLSVQENHELGMASKRNAMDWHGLCKRGEQSLLLLLGG
eukprot:443195-Amphidinium_carterae.1